jgi:hypothetical protein
VKKDMISNKPSQREFYSLKNTHKIPCLERYIFIDRGVKLKRIFILTLMCLLSACTSTYIEPPLGDNNATFKIQVDKGYRFNAPYGMIVLAEIDGKGVVRDRFADLAVKVSPGQHTLTVIINAYYYNRAKHYVTKKYKVDFKENENYIISAQVASMELKSNTDDVSATLFIKGAGINISDTFILEDSAMRSMVCQIPDCKPPIIIFL